MNVDSSKEASIERTAYWSRQLKDATPVAGLDTTFGDGSACPVRIYTVDDQHLVWLSTIVVARVEVDVLVKCATDVRWLLDGNYGERETHLFDDGYVSAVVSVDNSAEHGFDFDVAVYFDTEQDRVGTDEQGAPLFQNSAGAALVELNLNVTTAEQRDALTGFAETFRR